MVRGGELGEGYRDREGSWGGRGRGGEGGKRNKKGSRQEYFFSPTATESNRKWKDKGCYYEKMKIVCKIVVGTLTPESNRCGTPMSSFWNSETVVLKSSSFFYECRLLFWNVYNTVL
jgi:hypothetical protein